jgi:8-oxo-dGTP pyrophosphatase MutT (NUDIX family)
MPPPESSQPDFDEVRRKADEFARQAYADVFARFERLHSGLDVNLPIVSAIIEREHNGEKEILVQTRWKPDRDPLYSGTLEIPAGGMHVYENVYDAVKREVLEETGLRVTSFYPDIRTKTYAPKDDDCFAFVPFCCQQQLKGGLPRVGFVFLCQVDDAEPLPQHEEVKDIRWMKVVELRKIFEETPEQIFTLQLGASITASATFGHSASPDNVTWWHIMARQGAMQVYVKYLDNFFHHNSLYFHHL